MIFALLLASGLDMSLPEFSPQVDVSGNYIVSDFDVSENESSYEYISSEDFAEVSLSPSGEVPEVDVLEDEPVRSELVRSTENSVSSYLVSGFNFNSNTNIIFSAPAEALSVIPVYYGYTYEITSDAPVLRFATSIADGVLSTRLDSFTFTPSEDGFVFAYKTRTISATFTSVVGGDDPSGNDPSGNDPSGGDFDDTNIVQGLNDLKDLVDIKFRVLIFLVLINFSYPVVISICKNIVGGKS